MSIISNDPIHKIKNIKRLAKQILKEYNEYHDPNRFLGWSKYKRKYVLKKWK